MHNSLYILLINYKGNHDTEECLQSILENGSKIPYQIIVVDNSEDSKYIEDLASFCNSQSYDFSVTKEDKFAASNSQIVLIQANKNKGFAAANNVAISKILTFAVDSSIIWMLNNDTILEKGVIDKIYSAIVSDPDSSKTFYGTPLIDYHNQDLIQVYAGHYNEISGNISLIDAYKTRKNYQFNSEKINVSYPAGASMFAKVELMKKVGLLEESFFLYYEELDYSFRVIENGGQLKILNVLGVIHKQGQSTKSIKDENFILSIKNRMKVAKKYNKRNLPFVYLAVLGLSIPYQLKKGKFNLVLKSYKAIFTS